MPRFKNCSTFPLRGFKEREVERMKSHLKSYHRNCGHWSPLLEEAKGFLSVLFMSTLGISVPHTVSHSCSQNPKRRLRNDNESAFRIPRPATVIRRSGLASLPRSARTDRLTGKWPPVLRVRRYATPLPAGGRADGVHQLRQIRPQKHLSEQSRVCLGETEVSNEFRRTQERTHKSLNSQLGKW